MINRFWKGNRHLRNTNIVNGNEISNIVFERTKKTGSISKKVFYMLKPLIPRFLQIYMRQLRTRNITKNDYEGVELMYRKILEAEIGKWDEPFYYIWFWPDGYKTASAVTHDVETEDGLKNVLRLADIDERYHVKASFEFVPERYKIDTGMVEELKSRGFEIAIHGLKHDGKLFSSKKIFSARLATIKKYATQWHVTGFRSPSLLRNTVLMENLDFGWDSSFPDWDPYGPQPGGCRTIFPFFISEKTVELPVTLMQDHTLFEILNKKDILLWKDKFDYIDSHNGLANIIVHPDYIFEGNRLRLYCEYIEYVESKNNVWWALPCEIAEWWKQRDVSSIQWDTEQRPYIHGPAKMKGSIRWIRGNGTTGYWGVEAR